MRLTIWTGFWIFLLDQLSKYFVVHSLGLIDSRVIKVWPGVLEFRMAWNQGVNFGLLSQFDARWLLIALALGISGFVLWWVRKEGESRWSYIGAGLLVGGALGDVIDRFLYGAVADFLNVSCCGFSNPYSFNVADVAIFAGAVVLVLFTAESTGDSRKRKGK